VRGDNVTSHKSNRPKLIRVILSWYRNNISKINFIEDFLKYNKAIFGPLKSNTKKNSPIVLMELNISFIGYIVLSLISKIKQDEGTNIVSYHPIRFRGIKDRLKLYFFSVSKIDNGLLRPFKIHRSMGVVNFIQPKRLHRYKINSNALLQKIEKRDKEYLINLEVEGIRIGDLFYDWYLRSHLAETLDLNEKDFKRDFLFFCKNFYWWLDYFHENKVDSVFVSHTVYQFALPARVGLKFGAKVFLAAGNRIYQITSGKLWSDIEFLSYVPGINNQFGYEVDLSRAKLELNKLRQGSRIIAAHAYGSGYSGANTSKIIKEPQSINILIACHCFSDAPHAYGDMLFPDFGEWLNFIGELSKNLTYTFYAKPHPHFWDSDKILYRKFLNKFPNIIGIPSDVSNTTLFNQGINVVLTVNGTIAFEAAYEGILVINGSLNSPHVNYPFTLTPASTIELQNYFFNLENILKFWSPKKSDIEHFFDIHHLRKNTNFLFGKNTPLFYQYIGGYKEQFTNPKVLEYWMNEVKKSDIELVKNRIKNFLRSDQYFLDNWFS
jgi:hypothetical protein